MDSAVSPASPLAFPLPHLSQKYREEEGVAYGESLCVIIIIINIIISSSSSTSSIKRR